MTTSPKPSGGPRRRHRPERAPDPEWALHLIARAGRVRCHVYAADLVTARALEPLALRLEALISDALASSQSEPMRLAEETQ